jgi:hypothetical protein
VIEKSVLPYWISVVNDLLDLRSESLCQYYASFTQQIIGSSSQQQTTSLHHHLLDENLLTIKKTLLVIIETQICQIPFPIMKIHNFEVFIDKFYHPLNEKNFHDVIGNEIFSRDGIGNGNTMISTSIMTETYEDISSINYIEKIEKILYCCCLKPLHTLQTIGNNIMKYFVPFFDQELSQILCPKILGKKVRQFIFLCFENCLKIMSELNGNQIHYEYFCQVRTRRTTNPPILIIILSRPTYFVSSSRFRSFLLLICLLHLQFSLTVSSTNSLFFLTRSRSSTLLTLLLLSHNLLDSLVFDHFYSLHTISFPLRPLDFSTSYYLIIPLLTHSICSIDIAPKR